MRKEAARRVAAVAALLVAGVAARAGTVEDGLGNLARAEAGEGASLVRVGLEAAHALRISSSRPFRIVDPADGSDVWKERYAGETAAVAQGGPEGTVAATYRIQVGAFGSEAAAEAERTRLEKAFGAKASVHYVPDRGSWRVRIGEEPTREALGPLLDRLRAAKIEGAWIAEEARPAGPDVRLRLVDASYDSRVVSRARIAVVPAPGAHVEIEGKPYRGIVEIRLTRAGTVRAIDWVDLESYLLGVVPAEMGPEIWPQLEALKAQAVAARTYVQRNLGQFEDEGFDLCATPRCQVYGGIGAEHPLSDRAVAGTKGEILTWEGRAISALYTATCGGHTEDAEQIFPEEKAPYLRGVPCRAESAALAAMRAELRGREIAPLVAETGEDVTRDRALLAAAGIVDAGEDPRAPLTPAALRAWTTLLCRRTGRPAPADAPGDVGDLARAAASLVADAGWGERARVLLSEEDLPALVRDPAAAKLPAAELRALALLVQAQALGPFPDGSLGIGAPPSRARILAALARIADAYEAFGLEEATVSSAAGGFLELAQGKGSLRLPLAEAPFLFTLAGERPSSTRRLALWPGDRVRYRVAGDGRIDFLELRPPLKGVSDDRSAKVYSWEVRQGRAEIEEAVNRRIDVGRIDDLQVVRRGVSGRIVELRVVGERATTTVKGFDVRTLLGLRESLTTIEPQRDAAGRIEAVVFAGKGWGHGVGLCQVGAYGMALRGASYREILAHYYGGAVLDRIAAPSR